MIRWAIALVFLRLLADYLPYMSWCLNGAAFSTAMMWSCRVFPLMAAEVILQARKQKRGSNG